MDGRLRRPFAPRVDTPWSDSANGRRRRCFRGSGFWLRRGYRPWSNSKERQKWRRLAHPGCQILEELPKVWPAVEYGVSVLERFDLVPFGPISLLKPIAKFIDALHGKYLGFVGVHRVRLERDLNRKSIIDNSCSRRMRLIQGVWLG